MLLAIADFSDDEGRAYPSVPTLAQKCRMSKRNAQFILRNLEGSGELTIHVNSGPPPKYPNLFLINLAYLGMKQASPVKQTSLVKSTVARGEILGIEGVKPTSHKPSMNHQEPSEGAQALSVGVSKAKKDEITLAQFLERCKAMGEKSIPEDDPVWEYAQKVGIDNEMIAIAWLEFKGYWLNGEGKKRRMKDWRQTFRNAVRDNRARLWFVREGEQAQWTTAGEQARRAAA